MEKPSGMASQPASSMRRKTSSFSGSPLPLPFLATIFQGQPQLRFISA